MLKVIIDTNVFISGIIVDKGNPSTVIKAWRRTQKYQLFISEEIIQEVLKVMHRLNMPECLIGDWNKTIRNNAVIISPNKKIQAIEDDPDDNKFLECAVEAKAGYKHLKKLIKFEDIKIVNAKDFQDILAKE